MKYLVTKQLQQGSELNIAEFKDRGDAQLFAENKLRLDLSKGVKASYRLYSEAQLLESWPKIKLTDKELIDSNSHFNPTPFQIKPAPENSPLRYFGEKENNSGSHNSE